MMRRPSKEFLNLVYKIQETPARLRVDPPKRVKPSKKELRILAQIESVMGNRVLLNDDGAALSSYHPSQYGGSDIETESEGASDADLY